MEEEDSKPSYSTVLPSLVESSIVLSSLFAMIIEVIFRKNISPLLSKSKNPSNSQSIEGADASISDIHTDNVKQLFIGSPLGSFE